MPTAHAPTDVSVHRIEVFPAPGAGDPVGSGVQREAAAIGLKVSGVRAAHVYLIQGVLSPAQLERVRTELLADPVTEHARVGETPVPAGTQVIEIHPLPGVMDPVAQSVQLAIKDLVGVDAHVSTGWRYDLSGLSADEASTLAQRALANPVIQRVHTRPHTPTRFATGQAHDQQVRSIKILGLSDDQLMKLSREGHLFLSLEEMRAVRDYYQAQGRDPREIELETLAQTWSEHCVHKTLKANVRYQAAGSRESASGKDHDIDWSRYPNTTIHPDGSVEIRNLLKSTVAAATFKLIEQGVDWTLSVFKDNSGVIALDDRFGVCIKVETHNRPSAIEPYGGAATGVGGCIRDVIATGLGAKPIANTDVFCVARPGAFVESSKLKAQSSEIAPSSLSSAALRLAALSSAALPSPLPPGTLHPQRILQQVVAGVRDYGNRMGIPTVNGAVYFDDRYVGNPLVFCGCVGLIPRHLVQGAARAGDVIVALGGRTGRDGIHGATFSSAALEQNAADEFAHAVQIGNAITEKQVLDAVLRARDEHAGPLYHGMTDCGAGGFSSAIGEMGSQLGAEVHLERAPLKYPGLSFTEIWISEAQERLVLAVPPKNLDALRAICREESVEMAELGTFGTPNQELVLRFHAQEVGRLGMHFLHDGIPMPTRHATWTPTNPAPSAAASSQVLAAPHLKDALLALLAHPNIASKHWIIRQYDHEVQGATIVKPLVGPAQRGPSDASVLEPVAGTNRGIALGCGLQTGIGDPLVGGDPYQMTLAAIDESVRNVVCAGGDPARTAILDNFCWPSCAEPRNMGALVRACAGCYDGALAYRTPFVSGKDSLNNQLKYTDPASGLERVIEIPPTLLITAMSIVPDIRRCVTMDAKKPGHVLVHVGLAQGRLGGSHYQRLFGAAGEHARIPITDLVRGPAAAMLVSGLIAQGRVRSAHDVSDGGLLCAISEMLIAGCAPHQPIGAHLDLAPVHADTLVAAFDESPSRYVLEIAPEQLETVLGAARAAGIPACVIGQLNESGLLTGGGLSCIVGDLASVWLRPLDW